jgi:hypothetical protein
VSAISIQCRKGRGAIELFYSLGNMVRKVQYWRDRDAGWDDLFRTRCFKGVAPLRVCILQGQPEDWLNLRVPYGTDGSILQASMEGQRS